VFQSVSVVGRGRVGAAVAERLRERGISVVEAGELRVICVPDAAITPVALEIPPGPWVAHVAGAVPLSALGPHERRFSLHPLQTFTQERGAEQLDGSWAAVTAETAEAERRAVWLADVLGLKTFPLADAVRPLYHAAAVMTSNYLVTLFRCASRLFVEAGAPADALVPLLTRTIENGFQLTGPIARGDWETVERHLAAIRRAAPDLEPLYVALADATMAVRAAEA